MRAPSVQAFHPGPQHLLGLLLALLSPIALAEPAGQVIFISGNGIALDSAGGSRTLAKNAPIKEGDTILTRDGRVHIQLKDGAFLSLQPQTEFKVERYRYAAAGDAEDGVVMSLLKGGLRTISGLVGKHDRNAYSMKAAVATIGIRGTDYALELNDKLVGNVSDGAIEVCNGAGCVGVLAGQAFLVPALTEMPVLSERHVFLPPAPAHKTDRRPAARDQRASDEAAVASAAKGEAKQRAALEHIPAPPAADTAAPDVSRAQVVGGTVSSVKPLDAVAAPPGQAKRPGESELILVLPPPAARPSEPPGQLKKLDTGVLDVITVKPGKGVAVPPGQAKR